MLKDICARLPYQVKASYYGVDEECECIDVIDTICLNSTTPEVGIGQYGLPIEKTKPYLFPLLSMSEEQEIECQQIKHSYHYDDDSFVLFDWYDKNHIDYRGLIPMGLAIDATELNIY